MKMKKILFMIGLISVLFLIGCGDEEIIIAPTEWEEANWIECLNCKKCSDLDPFNPEFISRYTCHEKEFCGKNCCYIDFIKNWKVNTEHCDFEEDDIIYFHQ